MSARRRRPAHSPTTRRHPRKPLPLEVAPEFGAVPPTCRPLLVQPWKPRLQRALPSAENIRSLAAQYGSNELPAVSGSAADFLDRRAVRRHRQYRSVGLLAAQIAFVLESLSGGQQRGIDRRRADGRPDRTHRLADGVEKGRAGVLHEMPAIGDLDRVGQRPLRRQGVGAAAIARNDHDVGPLPQPRFRRRGFSVRQQRDRLATLKIADQRAVAKIAPPGPVVDADNRRRREASRSAAAHDAQQRVIAHHDIEPARKGGCRSASQRNRETVDHVVEPGRPSGSWLDRFEPFGEDPLRARLRHHRRSGGSAKSALSGRQRPEGPTAASDSGCVRGCKRFRTPGSSQRPLRLLSR